MDKVVTFGEIMLRLEPAWYYRILQCDQYRALYGGAEANVAVSLSNYGVNTDFITKLPEHEVGQAALNSLRKYGVGVNNIVRGGDRLGLYYIEKGASQRPSKVIYDRKGSAFALSERGEYDWEKILLGAGWLFFTGITPGVGGELAKICEDACKKAKEKNICVCCDINYRNKLWSVGEAKYVMKKLSAYIDICITNEDHAREVLDIDVPEEYCENGRLTREGYRIAAKKMSEIYKFKAVALTRRISISANDNKWMAMLYIDGECYFSRSYDIRIVDRVGGGDSFAAGLIYGIMKGMDYQKTLDFAVAASCLKHTVEGDFNLVTEAEVEELVYGDGSGRVQR